MATAERWRASGSLISGSCSTGVVEIHQAGDFLFQRLRDRLKDHLTKGLAVKVGLLCFPNGLEEPSSKVYVTFLRAEVCVKSDVPMR